MTFWRGTALAGYVGITRENEFDYLTEAETVSPPQRKRKATKMSMTIKVSANKNGSKKKAAA